MGENSPLKTLYIDEQVISCFLHVVDFSALTSYTDV